MDNNLLVVAFIIYLIGSIPFAFIITKISGHGDIRKIGSGNIGTTNVLRTGNKFLAMLVLIFDILKGYLPTFYISNYFFYSNNSNELVVYMLGSIAVLGHLFPFWLKFKGGKGIATYIGFIFAVDYLIGLIYVLMWILLAFFTKYSSLASICPLLLIPFLMLFLGYQTSIFLFFSLISIILILMHYSNIKRLLNNNESKIKF